LKLRSVVNSIKENRKKIEAQRADLAARHDEIRKACEKLSGFVREAWHVLEPSTKYVHGWHHDAMGEHLEAVYRGEVKRLIINQPPATMKSLITSAMFPAWEWTTRPELRYLTTSYKEGYARRDSRKHRDLVQSEWYQTLWPHIKLVREGEADFENTMKGSRYAVAFESLTAGRGNREMIDDPHSTEQVESLADIRRATRIFRESSTSRLNDPEKDAIIIIMHRLHPEDLCGVIEELGTPYTKLILPMEYTRSLSVKTPYFEDPRREEGELLHPERLGREQVEQNKIELGPHAYDTQYLQRPIAREGSFYFSRESLLEKGAGEAYVPAPNPILLDSVFAVMDTASKIGKKRDGTGVAYFGYVKHPIEKLYILDWDLVQTEASLLELMMPNVFKRAEDLAAAFHARMGMLGVWIEDKDSGVALLQNAIRKRLRAHAIPSEFTALGKDGRALTISGYVYRGDVRILAAPYNKVVQYKGRTANHLLQQVTTYRMKMGTPEDEDEMFDVFCYGVGLTFGNAKGV
jgi:hypothetical protein